jgi:hypothetical protein
VAGAVAEAEGLDVADGVGVGDTGPVTVGDGLTGGGVKVGVGVGTETQPDSAPLTARMSSLSATLPSPSASKDGQAVSGSSPWAISTPRTSSLTAIMPSPLQSPTQGASPLSPARAASGTSAVRSATPATALHVRQPPLRSPPTLLPVPRGLRLPHLTTS